MKHLIVKQQSTFERFKPVKEKNKNIIVYRSNKVHMCDGTKRGKYHGKNYKHSPVPMRHSGYAQSGVGVWITRWECPVCGMKTTHGREK